MRVGKLMQDDGMMGDLMLFFKNSFFKDTFLAGNDFFFRN